MKAVHMRSAALVALVLSGAGCATGNPAQSDSPFSDASGVRNLVQIDVLNNNFNDATLWAVRSGAERTRLGIVSGKSDARFSVPWRFSEPLRIEIDLFTGPRCLTREIPVDPGDVLQLEIQAVFLETSYCERR